MNMYTKMIAKKLNCDLDYALIIQDVIDCYFDIRWSEASTRMINATIKDAEEFFDDGLAGAEFYEGLTEVLQHECTNA